MAMEMKKIHESTEEIRTFEFDVKFSEKDRREQTYKQLVEWAMEAINIEMDLPSNGRSWTIDFNDRPGWDNTISFRVTARR